MNVMGMNNLASNTQPVSVARATLDIATHVCVESLKILHHHVVKDGTDWLCRLNPLVQASFIYMTPEPKAEADFKPSANQGQEVGDRDCASHCQFIHKIYNAMATVMS